MGYTHYWYRPKEFDKERFKDFVRDVRMIIDEECPNIHGRNGIGDPEIEEEYICFNGDRIFDNAYEAFLIDRVKKVGSWDKPNDQGLYFECCKTGRKEYDTAVVACLVALKERFPEYVIIRSDGNQEDLRDGTELARDVLGLVVYYKNSFSEDLEKE